MSQGHFDSIFYHSFSVSLLLYSLIIRVTCMQFFQNGKMALQLRGGALETLSVHVSYISSRINTLGIAVLNHRGRNAGG